jgi:hypothetical protein
MLQSAAMPALGKGQVRVGVLVGRPMGGENGAAGQQWRAGQVGGGADGRHCGSASAGRRRSDSTGLVTA